jgi:ferrous iron transport protein A
MNLSDLKIGDTAEVTGIKAEQVVRRRIMDMGLIKGTTFKVLRVAPLGDPIEIYFKGLYLALRKNEANGILVKKTVHDAEERVLEEYGETVLAAGGLE